MSQAAAPVARWEHFPHEADVGVRGFGASAAEAFEQAALALTAVVTRIPIKPMISVAVSCEAPDLELLFVEWLNAVIYEMAVRRLVFGRGAVLIEGNRLYGRAWGEPVDRTCHMPAVKPVKQRVPTRPTAASRERRRETKLARGRTKRLRQPVDQQVE